jgi:galactose mutarotase-like enzyme
METENSELRLVINPQGGCLASIYDKVRKQELLYQPKADSWKGQDIVIFPFIARLKDGTYQDHGKTYAMKHHGLLRYMKADETKLPNGDIVMSFASDPDTLAQYPYPFKAEARYHLDGKSIVVSYTITNTGTETLPYAIGGHPAFAVPGKRTATEFDLSGTTLRFAKKLALVQVAQDETASYCLGEVSYLTSDHLDLSKDFFRKIPTLILKADAIDAVTLEKTDGSKIRIHKKGIPYLAVWSDTGWGDYVAVEPWKGLPDELTPQPEISRKKAISHLAPGKQDVFSYTIEIL